MAKKPEIRVIEIPAGEIEPICLAARAAPRMVIGVTGKTFSNWRSQGKGPPVMMIDGVPYYPWKEFKEYFNQGRVKTLQGES